MMLLEANSVLPTFNFRPIGLMHSCFKEKFGIPRQPGLIPEAEATLRLLPPFARDEAVAGLERFSHIWVLFLFHAQLPRSWRPTVRPPRLGGNRRVGVFASRSPFRPNPIGLSAVRLLAITRIQDSLVLRLGEWYLDNTPVLDIKPYIPYADAIVDACGGFADSSVGASLPIHYSLAATDFLVRLNTIEAKRLQSIIAGVLAQNPYPAYLDVTDTQRVSGMKILDYDIRWSRDTVSLTVMSIATIK